MGSRKSIIAIASHYAIGSGSLAGHGIMLWRGITEHSPLDAVMYAAYEGKRIGETSRLVGKETIMVVLEPLGEDDFTRRVVRGSTLTELSSYFDRFGPKRELHGLSVSMDGLL